MVEYASPSDVRFDVRFRNGDWVIGDFEKLNADQVDVAVNALQQRELLEPVLLLSAGYLAVPFLLGQLRLLLTPLLFLLGELLGNLCQKTGSRHD